MIIAVVVISILAAITIVSYSEIQRRTEDAFSGQTIRLKDEYTAASVKDVIEESRIAYSVPRELVARHVEDIMGSGVKQGVTEAKDKSKSKAKPVSDSKPKKSVKGENSSKLVGL